MLKEALKGIWYAPSDGEGWRRWRSWMRQEVKESGLAPLQRFGRNLSKYMGILASANYPMHKVCWKG